MQHWPADPRAPRSRGSREAAGFGWSIERPARRHGRVFDQNTGGTSVFFRCALRVVCPFFLVRGGGWKSVCLGTYLLVLSRECGNEPRDPLKEAKGWFIRVIPSFPAEHQQV